MMPLDRKNTYANGVTYRTAGRCSARHPAEEGTGCLFEHGHGPIDDGRGQSWEHAAPADGAYWSAPEAEEAVPYTDSEWEAFIALARLASPEQALDLLAMLGVHGSSIDKMYASAKFLQRERLTKALQALMRAHRETGEWLIGKPKDVQAAKHWLEHFRAHADDARKLLDQLSVADAETAIDQVQ